MSAVVLGGGIAGLSACYYLSRLASQSVTLVEASSRIGGWIQSIRNSNGSVYETGPRTMRLVGVPGINTLELLEELYLEKEVRPVLKSQPAAKNRMLYVGGKLHLLPNSFSSLFKTIPPFSKPLITALLNDLETPAIRLEDDSIHSFVSRRFGSEIADYAISAMVCGICAGDAKKISVNLIMSSLFEWEQKYGGVGRGMLKSLFEKSKEGGKGGNLARRAKKEGWSVWSLNGGLEKLPQRLGEVLNERNNVEMLLESPCERIEFDSGEAEVKIKGKLLKAGHIYCGLPSYQLAKILPPQHRALQEELTAIPTVTVGVVNLEYQGHVLPIDGFGFLVPPNQKIPILGVIFDTCCFPQEGKTILTVMMGGAWFNDLFGSSPDPNYLKKIAAEEVKKALKISQTPSDVRVSILKDCIPQYIVGHRARVERIRSYITHHKLPITLLGSSYDGVGVNDVILSARRGVELQTRS